jgi:hypothetical protein
MDAEKRWLELSLPLINKIRKELSAVDPVVVAARSGLSYDTMGQGRGELTLEYFGRVYTVSYPELQARDATTEGECPPMLLLLFLHYLHTADGTSAADRWIAFRELPDGIFYGQAFQGYSGARLLAAYGNELGRFREAAMRAGGEQLSLGDAAFMFRALPRVPLGVVYWLGDDEFPPHANVLFDASASHYLSTDALAVLGSDLCKRIIRAS